MSVRVMAAVWETNLPDSEKIVLLALADCANDEGEAWPSMATLTRKCSKSDRTIQASIKSLVASGHLTRVEKPGKGCLYTVHPRSHFAPETASPPKRTTPTPEAASDNPSRTIIPQKDKPSGECARDPVIRAVAGWNELAGELGLPRVQSVNAARRGKLRARLRDHGAEGWERVLAKIRGSPFLRGERTGRACSLDFAISDSGFLKILEGNYDDRAKRGDGGERGSGGSRPRLLADDFADGMAAMGR